MQFVFPRPSDETISNAKALTSHPDENVKQLALDMIELSKRLDDAVESLQKVFESKGLI